MKGKSCREIDNATSGSMLKLKHYSDPVLTAENTQITCTSILFSKWANLGQPHEENLLKEAQLIAIKQVLNKAQEYSLKKSELWPQYNQYYKVHTDIAELHNRYNRVDKSKMAGLEYDVKIAKEILERAEAELPSEDKLLEGVVNEQYFTIDTYSHFYQNNLLLENLDYVSSVGADGRFTLDNSEEFNLMFIYPDKQINQKAKFKVIRLAEFGDQPLATVDLKDALSSRKFNTITL